MLDSHPLLAITREAEFIAPMAMKRSAYERRDGFEIEKFAKELSATKASRVLSMTSSELLDALLRARPSNYPEAVHGIYSAYAASRGKTIYGDKTPKYVLSLELLAKTFPDSRFIHLVRDGRDVALSFMNFATGPNTIPEAAAHWRRMVTAGERAGKILGSKKYHEVRFEALVKEPQHELSAICEFLGIEFSHQMLEYHRRPRAELASNPTKAVDRSPATDTRNWRTDMSPIDRTRFEAIAGDLLERLGYERSSPVSTLASSAARVVVGGKFSIRRLGAAWKRLRRALASLHTGR